jgi:peptidylprolyl isomerase
VRRRSALLAVPALLLTAAGCGSKKQSDPASSASPSASPSSSAPPVKIVSGPVPAITGGTKFGQKPVVAKGAGKPSTDLAVKTVLPGNGPAVASGDYVEVNYLGQIYETGKVFDNSYDRHATFTTQIGTGKVIPGWDKGLVGAKTGSRVELAIPPALGYGAKGQPPTIPANSTLVFVTDIVAVYNASSSAKGKDIPQTDAALPKIGTNTDGKDVSITVPKGKKAPTKLVSEYVIEGDGAVVKASDTLLLQYKGVVWDTGKEFDATYTRKQLADFPLAQLIKGWQQGLAGKKVGSRVMLVVPPALGYGSAGNPQGGIKGTDTLVFTLDIISKG